jgi:hypothetical protein
MTVTVGRPAPDDAKKLRRNTESAVEILVAGVRVAFS